MSKILTKPKQVTENVSTTRNVIRGGSVVGPPCLLIPLTKGQFAIVDDADFEWLSQWKWCAINTKVGFYAIRRSPHIFMHRVILGLKKGDGKHTDHRNGNGLDNRRENLRICTHAENMRNRKIQVGGTSRHKGVRCRKGKYETRIVLNRRRIYIGLFEEEDDAGRAYDKKAMELFGEFAKLNFPKELKQ